MKLFLHFKPLSLLFTLFSPFPDLFRFAVLLVDFILHPFKCFFLLLLPVGLLFLFLDGQMSGLPQDFLSSFIHCLLGSRRLLLLNLLQPLLFLQLLLLFSLGSLLLADQLILDLLVVFLDYLELVELLGDHSRLWNKDRVLLIGLILSAKSGLP